MVVALLLSGGVGVRMGGTCPKQYLEVDGRSIISYSVESLIQSEETEGIQVVAAPPWHEYITRQVEALNGMTKLMGFSLPGRNRQESIFHALQDCSAHLCEEDSVLIHDAARPSLSPSLIRRCVNALGGHDGVLPALAMKDTVYLSKDGKKVSNLLNRGELFAGQAPELFVYGKYYRANQALMPNDILEIHGSTEPAILAGMDIVMIPGDEENFKITTEADLIRFQTMLGSRKR